MLRPTPLVLAFLATLAGCNSYEMFRVAGYEQATFANDADILFLVDNSPSMFNEAAALGLNFGEFVENLVDPTSGSGMASDGLADAVDNYIIYVGQRGRFLDYQLAVTTTSADPENEVIDPGEAGTLVGTPSVISESTTQDVILSFSQAVMCNATCWPGPCVGSIKDNCIPYDPTYVCGEDPQGLISWEYLSCVCGSGWTPPENCGSGLEEGLEAARMALCRAVPNPPEGCYTTPTGFETSFEGSNAGLVRENSTIIVVIVTDEGDSSRLLRTGDEDPAPYLDIFDQFDNAITFAVVGPAFDVESGDFNCNSGNATPVGTKRYIRVVEETGGFYAPIEQQMGGECVTTPFSNHLNTLGELLNSLLNAFQLQSIPDVDTILVFVDGVQIERSACVDHCEAEAVADPVWGDGWTYLPSQNAIVFHGESVPDYNADVRIYYQPVSELPRSLPF
ncbi:MAG: hypothetical protein JXB39_16610 [Deltaproteobacteria bacterium]|nr:hypothetical protein [Deltaproteobacteria bacterium]